MNPAGYIPPEVTDEVSCTNCQSCMIYCPDFAIVVEKPVEGGPDTEEAEDD